MNYAKFANTYKNGKIISKKDKYGRTRAYTIEEVEQLIDELSNDKDENGKVKDPESLNNAVKVLMQLYRKYGNPHEKDIIEAIKKAQEQKPLEEQKIEALNEVLKEVDPIKATIDDVKRTEKEYDECEEATVIDTGKHLIEDPETGEPIVLQNGVLDQIVTEEEKNRVRLDSDHEDEYVDFEEIKEDGE